ncbi:MAG: UDP-3-O-(3-hydroxymyristoyl)glucosamine N-acyltransferase [Gammaproteobacteria bacterium]|nr:UDP-3-O-(3-hydroxymyristoyl)glucosamine N-acyltransferase [Gammaproteobacteria bacterium]
MLTLTEIAELVNGVVVGDENKVITDLASLKTAKQSSLSFYNDTKQAQLLFACQAGVVLLRKEHSTLYSGNKILVKDPYLAYAQVSQKFKDISCESRGIHEKALISHNAAVHPTASVGAYSIVDQGVQIAEGVRLGTNVRIGANSVVGANTVIEDNVVIYARSSIGERCCISSGAIIGASGFGYAPNSQKWEKIEQLGAVKIGNDVDIGANTTIDRGTLDDTIIGNGVKLDNQIQIAHNVQIGDNTIMAGCVAVAGSARIGQRCCFGGRVSVLGHLEIVDDVTVYSNGFVCNSIRQKGEYASMIPVQKVSVWRRTVANINRLEYLAKKIKALGKPENDR